MCAWLWPVVQQCESDVALNKNSSLPSLVVFFLKGAHIEVCVPGFASGGKY